MNMLVILVHHYGVGLSMKKQLSRTSKMLLAVLILSGCQAVNTTKGGAVGVERQQYMFALLSTEKTNEMYAKAYAKKITDAEGKGTLDKTSATAKRVNTIAQKVIEQAPVFRPDAAQWDWEVNLIDSQELNANCGPGGKIIVYTGIIDRLKLTDGELAAVLGHEVAHALREHGREGISETLAVETAKASAGALLGLSKSTMDMTSSVVNQSMTLPNSRENENEADLIGLELAARAGYNPNDAISFWQKMGKVGGQSIPEFQSTHPSSENRIIALEAAIPKVMPLYQQASAK